MQKGTKRYLFITATYAAVLFLGIMLGKHYNASRTEFVPAPPPAPSTGIQEHENKVQRAIDLISGNYVDSVDMDSLQHAIIREMVSRLDPHSDYIAPQDAGRQIQVLEGSFEGIGAEYFLLEDTVLVVGLVPEGPAQLGGIKVGDRILALDDEVVAGTQVTVDELEKLIKGRKGSVLDVAVLRRGVELPFPLHITRDQYEISSIDAGYLLSPVVGYVKINNFGARTVQEARQRIQSLKRQGAKNIVLDLRGNRGGFLSAGIELAGLFLPSGRPIVYTEGSRGPRTSYTAKAGGQFVDLGVAVLIDEESASASEIVAGAIQDYNRGKIIGRRSYGKGLIQERFGFGDGSVLNLTVARYYTPLGRSIQRPVQERRNEVGQIFIEGGILPDLIIQIDSAEHSHFYQEIYNAGLVHEFVYSRLTGGAPAFAIESFLKGYYLPEKEFQAFTTFLIDKGFDPERADDQNLHTRLKAEIEALLARYYFGSDAYFKTKNRRDQIILAALSHFELLDAIEVIESNIPTS